jgi:hypothetical protein
LTCLSRCSGTPMIRNGSANGSWSGWAVDVRTWAWGTILWNCRSVLTWKIRNARLSQKFCESLRHTLDGGATRNDCKDQLPAEWLIRLSRRSRTPMSPNGSINRSRSNLVVGGRTWTQESVTQNCGSHGRLRISVGASVVHSAVGASR